LTQNRRAGGYTSLDGHPAVVRWNAHSLFVEEIMFIRKLYGLMARYAVLAPLVIVLGAHSAQAQTTSDSGSAWPTKTIRVILPYPPGGNTDIIARATSQALSQELGQPVVVENRPGANGMIALGAVAKAPADGYTLLVTAVAQLAITPAMFATPYDPLKDFEPVSIIATNPLVLVIAAGVPAHSLSEFVEYARSRKDGMTYASSGDGGIPHLTSVQFFKRAGIKGLHIPYKGNAQIFGDILGGHVPAYFANLSEVLRHVDNKAIRLLAQTGASRAPQLPNVPTVAEQGFAGFESMTWNGVFAPAGTPKAIIERVSTIVQEAARDPSFRERMTAMGLIAMGTTPDDTRKRLHSDLAYWKAALDSAGIAKRTQ
jgi:tripartite-type tricarboxylate transporter receptor subunit TctC